MILLDQKLLDQVKIKVITINNNLPPNRYGIISLINIDFNYTTNTYVQNID